MKNDTAIKSELAQATSELAFATDKYDIHFINKKIASLKGQLSGVVAKMDSDYSSL